MLVWPFVPASAPDGGLVAAAVHRRAGWALRRYRGEHRQTYWRINGDRVAKRDTPNQLSREVVAAAERMRREHLRSLRRPFNPDPLLLGSVFHSVQFYAMMPPGGSGIAPATLEFFPAAGDVLAVPSLPAITADDAPTGPIFAADV